MNEEALAKEYLTETDPTIKRDILANVYRALKTAIYCICRNYTKYEDLEDLQQEAFFAVKDALDTYDPTRGSFKNYVQKYISWHLLRTLNGNEEGGRIMLEYRRICRYEEDFFIATRKKPTDRQTAAYFKTTVYKIQDIKNLAKHIKASISFDDEAAEGCTYAELIPGEADPEAEAMRAYNCQRIRNAVCRLPAEERQIIERRLQGIQYADMPEGQKEAYKLKEKAYKHLRSDKELISIAKEEGLLEAAFTWHYKDTSHTEWAAMQLYSMPWNA